MAPIASTSLPQITAVGGMVATDAGGLRAVRQLRAVVRQLAIDDLGRVVDHLRQPVDLRRREFELLALLCREVGRVVTRERLLAEVWDLHWETSTKTLDMHVMALRRKLGGAVDIATVRGVGYRFRED